MLRAVVDTFVSIANLFIYPLKNFTIWLIIFMVYIFYINKVTKFDPMEMFLFSAGLITILTFIVTYFDSNTIALNNKEDYYLGFNLRKRNLYENYWLKKFIEVPIKKFLWIIACIPAIMLSVKYIKSFEIIDSVKLSIFNKEFFLIEIIFLIWLSTVIVVCFLCTTILIESVYLTNRFFLRSKVYNDKNWFSKHSIERELEKVYELEFVTLFKNNNSSEVGIRASEITDFIFTRAKEVSKDSNELEKYIKLAYMQELAHIYKFYEKLKKISKKLTVKQDTTVLFQIFFKINIYKTKRLIKKIYLYYNGKWEVITNNVNLDNLSNLFIQIVRNDLNSLLELEKIFYKSKDTVHEDFYLSYRDIFWGIHSEDNVLWQTQTSNDENLCVAKIINFLKNKLRITSFYCSLNYKEDIEFLLDIIKRIDEINKENNYYSNVIECIFDSLLISINIQDGFFYEFKQVVMNSYYKQSLIKEISHCSYNKILNGYEYNLEELTFLLNFLEKKRIIIALIFTLAYTKRSSRPIMGESEFKIWKSRIIKLDYETENKLKELEKNNFLISLTKKINKSYVSHFIFDEFLSWIWKSLFLEFNKEKYQEFNLLGAKGIRRDFSLADYIIVRLLLLNNDYYILFNTSEYDNMEKEKLYDELNPLQEIFKSNNSYEYWYSTLKSKDL